MIKLLFIDDDCDLSLIVKNVLENIIKGYMVKTANNGKNGFELWKNFNPDIIISDVFMPEVNGFDFVKMIRNVDKDIPILFTSGIDTANNISKGYKIGINNYIKKPFTPDEIDAYIKTTLEMKKQNENIVESNVYNIGDYIFYSDSGKLHDLNTNTISYISALEAELLHLLVKNLNKVVYKKNFFDLLWSKTDVTYASFCLHTHIHNLRHFFKKDSKIQIKNIRSIGYMMIVDNIV